jgi:hypothetical protein
MLILQEAVETYFSHPIELFPKCFQSAKEYADWLQAEEESFTEPRQFVCRDCTVEYKNKMMNEGRCVIGHLPNIDKLLLKNVK